MAGDRKHLQQRLNTVVSGLPLKKLEQLADFAEYLKSREDWEATLELINDPSMRRDVDEGRKQAEQGEGISWREVQQRV